MIIQKQPDFNTLNELLLNNPESTLFEWLPDHKIQGNELTALNPMRTDKSTGSFKVNLESGKWSDFATEDKGGDLVSLYAYLKKLSNTDAGKQLTAFANKLNGGLITKADTGKDSKKTSSAVVPIPTHAGLFPDIHPELGKPSKCWAYHTADGERAFYSCRFETENGKETRPLTYHDNGQWKWKQMPGDRPLFNLHLLIQYPGKEIILAEGEKCAEVVAKLFPDSISTTTSNGSKSPGKTDLTPLQGRSVVVIPDADEAGYDYLRFMLKALEKLNCTLMMVDVLALGWDGGHDIADESWTPEEAQAWLVENRIPVSDRSGYPEAVQKTDAEVIAELAKLSAIEYDRIRDATAKELKIRTPTLDKVVANARVNKEEDKITGALVVPEPYEEPVDGSELLNEISAVLDRYLVLPEGANTAISLWILWTYCHNIFDVSPLLLLSSPEKRCGKSSTMILLRVLSFKGLLVGNITAAALFRCIDKYGPSLMVDEADTFLNHNDELRGILNSGHTKSTAYVIRTSGDDHEPETFSTWCPKAIAMIKKPKDTLLDRSIVIPMRRKMPDEKRDKLRIGQVDHQYKSIPAKCLRWVNDNQSNVSQCRPRLPDNINDRTSDNWEPLLAIATGIGGQWQDKAYQAVHALTDVAEDDTSTGVMLLNDIQAIFADRKIDRIFSDVLVSKLNRMEDRPWPEWRNGKPITQTQLARLLKPFDIKPCTVRIDVDRRKGYRLDKCADSFSRYIPPIRGVTPCQTSNGKDSSGFQSVTQKNDGTGRESREATKGVGCHGVTGQLGGTDKKNDKTTILSYPHGELTIQYVTDLESAEVILNTLVESKKVMGLDIETKRNPDQLQNKKAGLSSFTGTIRLIQLYDGAGVAYVFDTDQIPISAFKRLEKARLVAHNALFEHSFFIHHGIRLQLGCTLLQNTVLTSQPRIGLQQALKNWLGIEIDKTQQVSDWNTGTLTKDQIIYAGMDAVYALQLNQVLLKRIKAKKLTPGYLMTRKALLPVAEAMHNGLPFNQIKHQQVIQSWQSDLESNKVALDDLLKGVNPNSGKQMDAWLKAQLDKETLEKWPTAKKTGYLRLEKAVLEDFKSLPVVTLLLKHKQVAKMISTYGTAYQKRINSGTGRLYAKFNLLGARTGRMTCTDPNIQTLPNKHGLRECIEAGEGRIIMAADYSQIELRMAGLIANDKTMLDAYRNKKDLHRIMAANVLNKPVDAVTGNDRKIAKAINFGLLYNGGPAMLQGFAKASYGVDLTLEDAQLAKKVFKQTYKAIALWQDETPMDVQRTLCIKTLGGRMRYFGANENLFTESVNTKIQGTGADLLMKAISHVHEALAEKGIEAKLVNFVHDEIVLDVAETALSETQRLVREGMLKAFAELFPNAAYMHSDLIEISTGKTYAEVK